MFNIIKESKSPEEFEQRWTELMETTNLSNNEWLINMYAIRNRWVPAYVKHVFSAGMSSSQRVETSHSFLKKYVNKNNSLTDFITRFNRALAHQRHQELVANHTDMVEQSKLTSVVMMEQQMVQFYTRYIFLLFQKEVEQSNFYIISRKSNSVDAKVYNIQRFDQEFFFDRHRELTYYKENDFISCSCHMFEFNGYPCRHMLCYLKKKQVLLLPNEYILKRWTKNAKVGFGHERLAGLSTDDGSSRSLLARHGLLSQKASLLVDDASLTNARSTFLLNEFEGLHIRLEDIDIGCSNIGMSRNRSKSRDETQVVCDPNAVRAKGCEKRLKSSKEKAMSQSNRTCCVCNVSGHDKRTCPMLRDRWSDGLNDSYHSQYSYDDTQNDGFTSIASHNYDDANLNFNNYFS